MRHRAAAGPTLAIALLLVVVTGCAAFALGRLQHPSSRTARLGTKPDTLPAGLAGAPAPPIRLRDARGGTLDTRTLGGTPYAVTFLYTRCPDVCPLIGSELRQGLAALGADGRRVHVLAVSVDPRHDSPAAARAWLHGHREPEEFSYLIGSTRLLSPVWKRYYASPQVPGDPASAHTAAIWFVDSRGRIASKFSAGANVDPTALTAQFRSLLASEGH